LADIFEHPEVWRQRGLVGRQRAESVYGWETKIDQALKFYHDLR
jgi:glycosyltransferase involved in cell wall biosynthesis